MRVSRTPIGGEDGVMGPGTPGIRKTCGTGQIGALKNQEIVMNLNGQRPVRLLPKSDVRLNRFADGDAWVHRACGAQTTFARR
jgi:hypothetical protein